MARRLRELPLVCAAFADGELSYSKVRALTRVAGVEREGELLELARHATASQLERLLRAYRGVVAAERAAAGGRRERWLVIEHDDDGSVVVRGRFAAEEGALIVAALEAAQQQLAGEHDRVGADVSAGTPAERAEPVPDVSAGTPAADDERVADVSAGTPAEDHQPVSDVAAGTPADVDESVLDVSAGTPRVSMSEARADALVAIADSFLATGPAARTGGDRHQILVHVDVATLTGADESGRCELEHGAPLAPETARRLACDASIVRLLERDGKPLTIGRKSRSIPPALRRALRTRDRGCRFPGCGSRRFLDAHHIEHWARGGASDLDNLVHLCGAHHRLLHEGGFHIERRPDGKLIFRRHRRAPDPRLPARPERPAGPPPTHPPTGRLRAAVPRSARPRARRRCHAHLRARRRTARSLNHGCRAARPRT